MSYRCWTKATKHEAGVPRRSVNWVKARRDWLWFHEDRLTCGDWSIPFAEVDTATLYRVKQLFIRSSVLELTTATDTFQFGLNPWVDPVPHIPLELGVQNVRLGSILV
ncbi:MAG: hypothetical protein DWQ36_13955 [Acidobacteria bacterium]|nr:MAG: hypothetical protein DWQ30_20000 [Acidobacteriota bacterium]REK06311.1 MAG: hypothetical protein DWQ36_13955 [Acidobacteriota bacterium]